MLTTNAETNKGPSAGSVCWTRMSSDPSLPYARPGVLSPSAYLLMSFSTRMPINCRAGLSAGRRNRDP